MAKDPTEWRVIGHGPIEEVTENLWRVQGDIDGMALKRVMTIARRDNGKLVVHNAVALDAPSMKQIDEWGEVDQIIVPNAFHRIDAPRFRARYPKAQVFCPPAGRKKVEKVVAVDGTYEAFGNDGAISVETLRGTGDQEGVMIVKSSGGTTLVVNDAIFNMPHVTGFTGFVLRRLTRSTGGPRVSRIGKMFLVKDAGAFKGHFEELAETPQLKRMIVSHHEMVSEDVPGSIRSAMQTL